MAGVAIIRKNKGYDSYDVILKRIENGQVYERWEVDRVINESNIFFRICGVVKRLLKRF